MATLPSAASLSTIGGTISASPLNTNYTALQSAINDTLTILGGGTGGQALTGNGTTIAWTTVASTVYDRATSAVDVANTVVETNLYSKEVAAGDMGTTKMLRLTMHGDWLFNNSTGNTMTWRIYFGGSVILRDVNAGNVLGSGRQPWRITVELANLASAASQSAVASLQTPISNASAPANGVGTWQLGDNTAMQTPGLLGLSTLATVDTASAQTLTVSAQWSAASANNSWRMRYALLELI